MTEVGGQKTASSWHKEEVRDQMSEARGEADI